MLAGPKSPKAAYDTVIQILSDYINNHLNDNKSWYEKALTAKTDFIQHFLGKPLSLDQLKSYVKDQLTPQFCSPVKKVMFLGGNSSLMHTLLAEIEHWPTQEQYLTLEVSRLLKENETLQGSLLLEKSFNIQKSGRIEALELEIAELKQTIHQGALNEASRIGFAPEPILVNRGVLTPPATPNRSPTQEVVKAKKPQ